jgi:hypothetical protein
LHVDGGVLIRNTPAETSLTPMPSLESAIIGCLVREWTCRRWCHHASRRRGPLACARLWTPSNSRCASAPRTPWSRH